MMTTVKFAKVNPNAIIPSKNDEDMGYDIYACFEEDSFEIPPHQTKLVPTGIASACDKGFGFVLKERGSTGSKGIAQRCGVIDSGYRDAWFVPLCNTTNKTLVITKRPEKYKSEKEYLVYPYTKAIAQALVIPVPEVEVEEYTYEELKQIDSMRGMGKLGSSNK